ncbi:uncharacterized protein [Branchiostoma lanceolatum]|uniref:uncharacterized protein n=1 Tax=Branchiostoma lanceolatum TaxID=7740 RepID=UPI003454EB74
MMLKFWILVVCLLAANFCRKVQSDSQHGSSESSDSSDSSEETIQAIVTLRIQNSLDPDWPSAEYNVSVPVATSVFDMMVAADEEFDNFTFDATYFPQFAGHFIDSINGLAGNSDDQTFWRFENKYGVAFDRGVDLILVHANDDVIVFTFASWATGHP